MLDDADQRRLFLENDAIKDAQAGLRLLKNVRKDGHQGPSEESGDWDTVLADELLELGLFLEQPGVDVVRQAEHLGEASIVHGGELAVLAEKLLEDDESAHFVEVDPEKDQSAQEVHTLTVADFWAVLRESGEDVEQRVLLGLNWGDKLRDLPRRERPLDIKADLLMHSHIVHRALFKIKRIRQVS